MVRLPKLSKLAPRFALVAALALLAAGIVLARYVDHTYQVQKRDEVTAQARILAATVTAALAFDDRQAAQEYVRALRANPEIVAAGIYDAAGRLFASFPPVPPPQLPARLGAGATPRRQGAPEATAPVSQDGTVLGTVLLQTQEEPLLRRAQRYGPIALLLGMAALLIGVLGVSQVELGHANAELSGRARDLADANRLLEEQIARREQVEAALQQAQKMEAIGQLTGGVAHDFNNLLQIVLGSLDRLRTRAERNGRPLDADLDRLVAAAISGAQRAASLTARLLAFARRQPLAPKPIEMNKLVAGMSELLARTLGESVRIETVLAGGLWRVSADENQLENALLNLAVNARDAMPGGGDLTIETANAFLDEAYARGEQELRPGQYVMLAVTDTGSGMPREVLDKVFEPFFTTKGIGQGTGLGLSQVYGFIKQSDGHVKVYSEPGEGTTVKLYLPRLLAGTGGGEPAAETSPVPTGSDRECILVVEDEDDVRALTAAMLRDLGYAVLEAGDGPSALALLEGGAAVQLLFTDVGLPGGMNGRQLADAARTIRSGLRVLFTTGYARNAIIHHGRLDPGVALIGKPFSAAEVGHRVRTILDSPTAR